MEHKPPPNGSHFVALRLSLEGEVVADVSIVKCDDEAWAASATGAAAQLCAVQTAIDNVETSRESESYPSAVIGALRIAGFSTEVVAQPATVSIALDTRSGRAFATATSIIAEGPGLDPNFMRDLVAVTQNATQQILADNIELIESAARARDLSAVVKALNETTFVSSVGHLEERLLLSLINLDIGDASCEHKVGLLRWRAALAARLKRWDIARMDATILLNDFGSFLTQSDIIDLRTTIGVATAIAGSRDSAIARFREVECEDNLTASQRGWIHRNIALALGPKADQAVRAARLSADAFIEAGELREVGGSLALLSRCLLKQDPTRAIDPITELIDLFSGEEPLSRAMRGQALHMRAQLNAQFGSHQGALVDALAAVALTEGVVGAEIVHAAALNLAAIEAEQVGDACSGELGAKAKVARSSVAYFDMASSVATLLASYDSEVAAAQLDQAEGAGAFDLAAAIRIAQVTHDRNLSASDKLEILESCLNNDEKPLSGEMRAEIALFMAELLSQQGNQDLAEQRYRAILDDAPTNGKAFIKLVANLWKREQWGDAAILARRQVRLLGRSPSLLFIQGKSQLLAGDAAGAIPLLNEAKEAAGADLNLQTAAANFLQQALDTGAKPRYPQPDALETSVTLGEVDECLDQFRNFISADKRMGFWKQKKWIAAPERRAQDLLHTYLKARFHDRVIAFEEVVAGPGRLDIHLQFAGGLTAIIELKMCGGAYSSTYAAAGEDQLVTYLQQRQTNIGYLMVFDGRSRDAGKPVLKKANPRFRIREIDVVVTPTIAKRTKKTGGA